MTIQGLAVRDACALTCQAVTVAVVAVAVELPSEQAGQAVGSSQS